MIKNKMQKCVTYVLKLSLKHIIRITCKLGDLLSQQFGIDCTCALDSLSQLNVLHRLHADMLIGCLTMLVCGLHACFVFCGQVCFRNISTEQLPFKINLYLGSCSIVLSDSITLF